MLWDLWDPSGLSYSAEPLGQLEALDSLGIFPIVLPLLFAVPTTAHSRTFTVDDSVLNVCLRALAQEDFAELIFAICFRLLRLRLRS